MLRSTTSATQSITLWCRSARLYNAQSVGRAMLIFFCCENVERHSASSRSEDLVGFCSIEKKNSVELFAFAQGDKNGILIYTSEQKAQHHGMQRTLHAVKTNKQQLKCGVIYDSSSSRLLASILSLLYVLS